LATLGARERLPMVNRLEDIFPGLREANYRVTSPPEKRYNCIAWAAGDQSEWWWPVPVGPYYWPKSVPRVVTLEAFHEAFATLGYVVCEQTEYEPEFEKIAIYATADRVPQHAARQLPGGRWTSKLGRMEDIEHALSDLEGAVYGSVVLIMKRPLLAVGQHNTESQDDR